MKLKIWKFHMYKALVWYTETLHATHRGLLTPAKIEILNRDLNTLQQRMISAEPSLVWKVPVGLYTVVEKNHFEVVVSDETNILYMDPE